MAASNDDDRLPEIVQLTFDNHHPAMAMTDSTDQLITNKRPGLTSSAVVLLIVLSFAIAGWWLITVQPHSARLSESIAQSQPIANPAALLNRMTLGFEATTDKGYGN